MCAGDDLVLAQYGGKDEDKPMEDFLNALDKNLIADFEEIPYRVTFAGGHASSFVTIKEKKLNQRIRDTYFSAQDLESLAKHHWKTQVSKSPPDKADYLTKHDGSVKDFIPVTVPPDDCRVYVSDTPPDSIIVQENSIKFVDTTEEKERPIEVIGPCSREQVASLMAGITITRLKTVEGDVNKSDYTKIADLQEEE